MTTVYQEPTYYELAFSFRDIDGEVDALAAIAERYVDGPVRSVFEVACGSAPHLPALLRKGHRYWGLDISEPMLAYARERAAVLDGSARFLQGSLADFTLPEQADLAVVFLGSLYVTSTAELTSHFDAMARALRPGGLYVLDWCVDFAPGVDIVDTWEEESDGVSVQVTYTSRSISRLEQTYCERLTLEIDDHGRRFRLEEESVKRAIYPQEFLLFLRARDDLEHVGWWPEWRMDAPVDGVEGMGRVVTGVRRLG